MAVYMAARRQKRRSQLLDLAGNKCSRCESSESLEFNHIDRSTKLFGLSGAGLDKAWTKVLAELEKCELLCSACHREYTNKQYASGEIQGWSKGIRDGEVKPEHLQWLHGTSRMYNERACRCAPCKLAKSKHRIGLISYNEVVG